MTNPPYVFESERRITISNSIESIKAARNKGGLPVAFIGDRISINGESVVLPLTDEPGRNIAIIGTSDSACNQAAGIMQSIAISLAIQNTKGCSPGCVLTQPGLPLTLMAACGQRRKMQAYSLR